MESFKRQEGHKLASAAVNEELAVNNNVVTLEVLSTIKARQSFCQGSNSSFGFNYLRKACYYKYAPGQMPLKGMT